jgi:hypothetical protein
MPTLQEVVDLAETEHAALLAAARGLCTDLVALNQRLDCYIGGGTYLFNPGVEHESRWLNEDGPTATYTPLQTGSGAGAGGAGGAGGASTSHRSLPKHLVALRTDLGCLPWVLCSKEYDVVLAPAPSKQFHRALQTALGPTFQLPTFIADRTRLSDQQVQALKPFGLAGVHLRRSRTVPFPLYQPTLPCNQCSCIHQVSYGARFRPKLALGDTIGAHVCFETSMCV